MRTSPTDWIVTFAYYAFDYSIGSYYYRHASGDSFWGERICNLTENGKLVCR